MTVICPVSSLQYRSNEPIYFSKNGVEYLVLMDADAFAQLQKKAEKSERKDG